MPTYAVAPSRAPIDKHGMTELAMMCVMIVVRLRLPQPHHERQLEPRVARDPRQALGVVVRRQRFAARAVAGGALAPHRGRVSSFNGEENVAGAAP